jgi:hypothetical protein
MEMSSQSAVTAATSVVAVIYGVAARTTFEVVSKSSFEILSGRIGVVRAISGVMALPYFFGLAHCLAYTAIDVRRRWSIPFRIRSWSVFGEIGTVPVIRIVTFLIGLIGLRRS